MPYNKGDFTQQGVDGYVNGGLLMNNKRDVTARISTDEESAGIDSVDIKIKDHLNDIEYRITGENLSEGSNVIGGGGSALLLTADENFALDHTNSEIISAYESGQTVLLTFEDNGITICESMIMYQTQTEMYILFFGFGNDKTTPSASNAYPVLQ